MLGFNGVSCKLTRWVKIINKKLDNTGDKMVSIFYASSKTVLVGSGAVGAIRFQCSGFSALNLAA